MSVFNINLPFPAGRKVPFRQALACKRNGLKWIYIKRLFNGKSKATAQ